MEKGRGAVFLICVVSLLEGRTVADPPASESLAPFTWTLPAGFPPPRVPESNPMSERKVELGRLLFYDTRLSSKGTLSCGGCHRPELAFTDGQARALGVSGDLHPRSAMSLANVAYNTNFAWADPAVPSLEAQALIPMLNMHPVEMGIRGHEEEVLGRFSWDPRYGELFAASFGERPAEITLERVAQAIAAFERTLISGRSSYDRLLYDDEVGALSEAAKRGMRLFFSDRLGCFGCHGGFNFSGPTTFRGAEPGEPAFHNTGLYDLDGRGAYPAPNRGLFEHSGEASDMGRFRAPTLRNIAKTAPYMHDGSIPTLAGVLEHYAAGGRSRSGGGDGPLGEPNPLRSPRIQGFSLDPSEKEDLIRFLHSLTDEAFLENPLHGDPWVKSNPAVRLP